MYENIKKAIADHESETLKKFSNEIRTQTAKQLLDSWYYRDYMTPATFEAMKQTEPTETAPAELLAKMEKKKAREEAKNTAKRLEKLAQAEQAATANYIDISVEWVRSRTWGANPHATVTGEKVRTFGTASGCGYDKQSAAIASAFNENPEILKIIYDHAEAGQPFPYSVNTFAGVPYFNGGCGVSCFESVFKSCGYIFRCTGSGNWFDCYTITRNQ